MKIIIDTNVVISGLFFGGYPRKVLEAVIDNECEACASIDIIVEYEKVIDRFSEKNSYSLNTNILNPFISKLSMINVTSNVNVCRDKDDNKFIECALDAKALYIVSGDEDLLSIKEYKDIQIITAKEFIDLYL